MTTSVQPALAAFVACIDRELVVAQVWIQRTSSGYELRHLDDAKAAPAALRLLPVTALRELAQLTAAGAFRPLKSAPHLQGGWRTEADGDAELETALHGLYPGALADWFASQGASPPVTGYREFTERQTGMYRVTTKLNDEEAAGVIRACCRPRFCLKRRLWSVGALETDRVEEKSLIPCLEPCAVLLEMARKAARIEQEEKAQLGIAPEELATMLAALELALAQAQAGAAVREADFNSPLNPRRLQWLLDRLAPMLGKRAAGEEK